MFKISSKVTRYIEKEFDTEREIDDFIKSLDDKDVDDLDIEE